MDLSNSTFDPHLFLETPFASVDEKFTSITKNKYDGLRVVAGPVSTFSVVRGNFSSQIRTYIYSPQAPANGFSHRLFFLADLLTYVPRRNQCTSTVESGFPQDVSTSPTSYVPNPASPTSTAPDNPVSVYQGETRVRSCVF